MLIPQWALRLSLRLRKFTPDFLPTVLSKRALRSVQPACLGSGSVIVSAWTHLHCQEPHVSHFRGVCEGGVVSPLLAPCCGNRMLRLYFQDDAIREGLTVTPHFRQIAQA